MVKLEFDDSQIVLLYEIKAPYDPDKDYIKDYSSDKDCPLSILVEHVKNCEVDYAQSTDAEMLNKASEVAHVADILIAYEEHVFAVYESSRTKEAA